MHIWHNCIYGFFISISDQLIQLSTLQLIRNVYVSTSKTYNTKIEKLLCLCRYTIHIFSSILLLHSCLVHILCFCNWVCELNHRDKQDTSSTTRAVKIVCKILDDINRVRKRSSIIYIFNQEVPDTRVYARFI